MYREPIDDSPYPRDPRDRVDPRTGYERSSRVYGADRGYGSDRDYGADRGHGSDRGYGADRGYGSDRDYGADRGYGSDRGYGAERGRRSGAARREYDADPGDGASWGARVRRRRKEMPLWQELPLLLIVAFCLAVLVRTFLVQAFFIPSGSMEPRLLVGDRVLVNKVVYDVRQPEHGEIVVFRGTDNWAPENQIANSGGFFAKLGRTIGDLVGVSQPGEKDFIKRVIGLPGDTVACCDVKGRVTVNGFPLDEPYVVDNSPLDAPPNAKVCQSRRFGPIKVEQGQMFVMGDHRLVSQDSRCQGQVPIANVIGRAFVIVWPGSHWSGLGVPPTFTNVPRASAAAAPGHAPAGPTPVNGVPELVITAPILASSAFAARSRRTGRRRGRRLLA